MHVYVYPADVYGCGYYRLIWVSRVLAKAGHNITLVMPGTHSPHEIQGKIHNGHTVAASAPADADVMVMQRVTHRRLAEAIPLFRSRGIAVVIDMDDDLSHIHPSNPAWNALHPSKDGVFGWDVAQDACRDATLVTVSTDALTTGYAPHGRVAVLRNCVPEQYLQLPHTDSDVVGWGGALASHPDDLTALGPSMARHTAAGGKFRVVGPPQGVQEFLGIEQNWSASGGVPMEQWPHQLASDIGIGIAPLADTRFNRSKCLDASTRISTQRGLIPVDEITDNDSVWNEQSGWCRVEAVDHTVQTQGFLLTMSSGRQLRLTGNHRLLCVGTTDTWRQVSDLCIKDNLRMTPDVIGATELQRAAWPADSRMSRRGDSDPNLFLRAIDGPSITITERWGRFLGLFAGDGCASGTQVIISCDGKDQDLIDLISEDVLAMGLWPATEHKRMYDGTPLRRRSISVSSSHLIRFLRSLGVVEQDTVRRIITVPEIIWRSPQSVVAAYLAGLFEADGTVGSSVVSLSTKYPEFALQVQQLLVSFGIESRITKVSNTAKSNDPKRFTSYRLSMCRAAIDVFVKEIGFLSDRKSARLALETSKSHSNRYTPMSWVDTIDSIEHVTVNPVDIQVFGQVFAAAGFVSHNSWLKPIEYSALGIPWIASPRTEYARLHREGAGLLAKRPRDWERLCRELASDPVRRKEMSEEGREIAARHTIEGNSWQWLEAWERALEIQRG